VDPAPATTDEPGDDAMILVPTTTLTSGSLAPTGKVPDEGGEGKGKGKGKEDAGVPAPVVDAGAAPPSMIVPAFWIDAREVSVAAYAACVATGTCADAKALDGCTQGLASHPVDCVTLADARAYCTWRGKRLVSNDEFTAAAAGSAGRAYPWGADAPSPTRLDACGAECSAAGMYAGSDGFARTAPSGSFAAGRTPEGVFDLAGNVAEWVDAAGASIVRGGSYTDVDPAAVASRAMRALPEGSASPGVGFRCAR
jgi:formylglycine-generating enzyme required for sulfatase activity